MVYVKKYAIELYGLYVIVYTPAIKRLFVLYTWKGGGGK